MKSLQTFFEDIKNTFYSPAFYASIPAKNTGNAVLFLLGVSALSAVGLVISFSILIGGAISSFSSENFVSENYPAGLVVTIKDGQASTNQPEPYIVPLKEDMKDKEGVYENMLVIDTRPDVTLETLDSYKAFAVLTKDRAFLASDDSDGRVIPLSSVKDFTLDQATVENGVQTFFKVLWIAFIPVALFVALLIAVFSLVFHLIASILGALLVMIAGMIRKNKLEYGDAYKIALFASAPIILVQTVTTFFGVPALPYFLDVLLFVVIVLANLNPKPASV